MGAIVRRTVEARLAVTGAGRALRRLAPVEAVAAFAVARAKPSAVPMLVPRQLLLVAAKLRQATPLTSVPVPAAPSAATAILPVPSSAASVGPTRPPNEPRQRLVPVVPVRETALALAPRPPAAVPLASRVPIAIASPLQSRLARVTQERLRPGPLNGRPRPASPATTGPAAPAKA